MSTQENFTEATKNKDYAQLCVLNLESAQLNELESDLMKLAAQNHLRKWFEAVSKDDYAAADENEQALLMAMLQHDHHRAVARCSRWDARDAAIEGGAANA